MKVRLSKHPQSGFTLIEVLITLIVLSIGLLGIAGLQILARKNSLDSMQRTSATYLAEFILARMRGNPDQLAAYLVPNNAPLGSNGTANTNPRPTCENNGLCSPADLAVYDLWTWEMLMDGHPERINNQPAGGLLNPSGCITGPVGGGPGFYTVTVTWRGITPVGAGSTSLNGCGLTRGLYDDQTAGDGLYRRLVSITTYL